jgi:hypothetical protein
MFFDFFSCFVFTARSRKVTTQIARTVGDAYVAALSKGASEGREKVPYELKRVESLAIENDVVAYTIHPYPDGFLTLALIERHY